MTGGWAGVICLMWGCSRIKPNTCSNSTKIEIKASMLAVRFLGSSLKKDQFDCGLMVSVKLPVDDADV